MATAIYELDNTGAHGEYEATGVIHWYCCMDHAGRHAIAEGFRTSANFSAPTQDNDAPTGTKCEWCGDEVQP